MSDSVISEKVAGPWCTNNPRHDDKWRYDSSSSGKHLCKHVVCRAKRSALRKKLRTELAANKQEDEEATAKRRKLATVSEASAAVVYNPVKQC